VERVALNEIVEILQAWFVENRGGTVEPQEDFVEAAQMDSFEVLTLVTFCEQRFEIQFSGSDLESDRFITVAGLAELIRAHLPGGAAP
jgi:acyl carrier protein